MVTLRPKEGPKHTVFNEVPSLANQRLCSDTLNVFTLNIFSIAMMPINEAQ